MSCAPVCCLRATNRVKLFTSIVVRFYYEWVGLVVVWPFLVKCCMRGMPAPGPETQSQFVIGLSCVQFRLFYSSFTLHYFQCVQCLLANDFSLILPFSKKFHEGIRISDYFKWGIPHRLGEEDELYKSGIVSWFRESLHIKLMASGQICTN